MAFSEKTLVNIMSCDGYICAENKDIPENEISEDINKAIIYLYSFEQRFSRFIKDNELHKFNENQNKTVTVSEELYEMLSLSKKYFDETNGAFDISILDFLIQEGYAKSKDLGFTDEANKSPIINKGDLNELKLEPNSLKVNKPKDLKIDLGGIGKSYAINKVANMLDKKYKNYCVSLGGDMKLCGVDTKNSYKNWAIEVENPIEPKLCVATLLVNDMSVATSGVNRRKWLKDGQVKNHIIDTKTNSSLDNNLLTVTVLDKDIIRADVLAKTILILGLDLGLKYCESNEIPALLIDKKLNLSFSSRINQYVWKE